MKTLMSGTSVKMAGLIAALSFCLVVIPRSGGATQDPQAGPNYPMAGPQVSPNLAIDPYGRVVDLTFPQEITVNAPWDRFRFDINIVRPLARDAGAFLGDLTGDGLEDLVMPSFTGETLFFPGVGGGPMRFGSGSYLRHTQATPAENPFSFGPGDWHQGDTGDLDGDGAKDAVIGSVLYRNAGTGSEPVLDPVYGFTGGGTFDPSASIGDLNADGKPDVVITWNYANGNSHIYWNNSTPGNFSFTRQALNNPHASSSQHLALGDINGDGLLDLVCPDGIYLNSGTPQVPSFDFVLSPWNKTGGPAWPATSDQPSHVVLRDGDGDGLLDAYVSDLSTTLFQVLFYKNVGTAAAHSLTYAGPVVCDAGPTDVYYHGETTPSWSGSRALAATGDIDNNGSPDVLLTPSQAFGFSYPTILWNYPAAGGSHTLGYQDLYTYPSLDRIGPSCGADSFTSPDAACGPPHVFGGWKDVTGDGAADALRLNQGANFSLYKRVRSGTLPFNLGPDIAVNTPSGPQAAAYGLAWVDVDLDNRVDVIGGDEDGHLRWYRNIAMDGSFVPADPVLLADLSGTPIDVGQQSWPAAIDLDGDSDLDLLVSNYSGNILEVFCVTPGGPQGYALGPQLGTPQQNPLDLSDVVGGGLIAPTVTTIDVNGDGKIDVVAGDPSGRLWLLRNVATTGTASFVLEPLVISRTQAAYLETVDAHTVRLRFALPAAIGARISFHDVVSPAGPVSGEVTILNPALGNYSDASVQLGANTTVTPDTAPITAASLSASTSTAFKGTLSADPATGVVHVTNAQPAGTYLVTVTAFNSAGTKTFTLTVNNPTPCDSLHFSAASGSPVTVGSLPAFEAVGDFNGDGNQDFAVANWGANNVTVLLGNGSGGFSASTGSPFAVGSHPTSIAVGDFDGNGRQDLAITKDGLFDNVTVLLGNGSGGFSPASGSPFDAGYTPQSVAVGDFNGDGKPDLATANWNSNNVTVLLGNGGGGFSAAAGSPFPAATNPASVAIGDFNGDGKADLTIANRYANSVTVLLGNGGGGFNAAGGSPFTVGANPTSVAVGDFNRDGKVDFATANRGASNVSVLLGDGGGSFSPATGSPFAIGSGPLSVACGDFNGDGKLDLTTANIDSNNVTVLLGNGSGGFSAATGSPFAVGSSPYLVVAGDFNGDGKLDLTSVNDGSNNVSVLLNTCTANIAPAISALGVTRQQEIRSSNETIANVNDLEDAETSLNVTVNGGASATVNGVMVSIISTSATGVVTASVVTNCAAATATFTLRVTDTAGLFNEATLTVTVIPNTAPALTYASPQSVVLGGSLNVTPIAAGDNGAVSYSVQPGHGLMTAPTVDSAGVVSITNAQPSGAHTITIRATDNCGVTTDGAFTLEVQPQPPTLGAYPNTSVTLGANATVTPDAPPANTTSINVSTSTNFKGKLEGDPTTGIVRATDAHPAGVYSITVSALNSGAGATTKTFTLTVTTPATCNPVSFAAATNFGVDTYPVSVAVGDFNGDGKQDLASANETANNVSILLGTGTGGFGGATNFSVGTYPYSVAVGDFNGDGHQDLATANSGSGNVSILLGTGTGSFGAATNFAAGAGAMSVAIGDFNGDGNQDVATANTSSDSSHTVSILLGTGTGSFGAATDIGVGNRPYSVAIGDFNGDGHEDLAVANESAATQYVSILLGTGTGSFGAAMNFGVSRAVSVAVGDFNGDGHQDLATANYWPSTVSILLGTGSGSFAAAGNFGVGTHPTSVAAGDFNGDGKQDLSTGNKGSNDVSILLGTGTGSFGAAMNFGVGTGPNSVAVGDFNGDGQQDIASANPDSNNVSVLLRQCQPTLSINSSATQTEGDNGETNMTFTVTLSGTSSQTVTVHYSTADGSVNPALGGATCGGAVDYVTTAGTLTFNPSDTTRTIDVPVCGDTRYEPSETLNVTLDTPANATIASGTGTGTITDNDAMPAFTIDDVAHNEGNTGTISYTFTVTKSGSTELSSSVNFATVDGTAMIAGNDYHAQSGTLTFLSTDTTKTIIVLVNGDITFESDEVFTVLLSGATNATISDAVGSALITNDDNAPAFFIDDAAQPEGNVGTTVFTFTVTKTDSTALVSSVDFTTVDGTATVADNDYQPTSGTLIFQPADTSRTITVLGNGDLTIELHETFTVHLSSANNATITDADGNGFIANDDMPVFSIDDVTHVEGNGGTTAYTFTVTKTGSTTLPAAVSFATVDGSATTADNDYQPQSGRLTFQPSETTQTITVPVNGDTTLEPNETFTVHLSSPSGSTIGDADGVGTITNDDVAPPTLGNYPNKTVQAGANTTVTPVAAPTGTTSLNASTAGAFKGTLAANPTTGVVYVTNAQPAGTYSVTITAFNSAGATTTKTFTLTVTNPAPCDLLSFGGASGSPFAAGTHPIFVAVGDFNLDGKQDVATTNEGSNDVTVLLGAGGGVFNPASGSPFAAGTQPESLAVGDFNGDGKPDLAAANYDFSNVTVLLGDGLGGFISAPNSPFATGFHPRSIAVGDFNGDGKPDLVTASASSASVTLLLGNGSGGFSEASGSPVGVGNGPLSIAVGDFNSDGKPDVATANRLSNNVSVLLGDGSGGFSEATGSPFAAGSEPYSIAVGDFNADGKLDLTTANNASNNVTVLLGNGSGGFTAAGGSPFAVGTNPASVAVGDFNGDGKPDLITANWNSNNVTMLLGNGGGGFSEATGSPLAVGAYPYSVAVGDYNADGRLDLATANHVSNDVTVLLNSCTQNTAPTISPIAVSRQQGSPSANSTITNVNDLEDLETVLTVTVNSGTSATVNGVTLSGISVSAAGVVTADVIASCTATTATFTLRVTDTGALFNEATLTVTVNQNSLPILTYASPQSVIFGGVLNVVPTSLSDNGAATYQVMPGHGLTSVPTVDSNGVVSITNTQPEGGHFVTIRATDNCGAVTDASFSIDVGGMPRFAINDVSHNEGDTGTLAYTFTVTKTGNTAANSSVSFATVDGSATSAGNDYQPTSGVLNFLPADTTKQITVVVVCDTTTEPDESFTVHLSAPSGARITAGDGTGAIINDDCSVSLSNNAENFTAAGGAASVTLTTSSACTWTAVSNDAFITINSGASGFGNGTVNYSVAVNTGPARTGTMTIAAQTFTVTQDSGCAFLLSSGSQNFVAGGGASSVNVITATGCQWAAVSNNAFITIDSGSTGSGNGMVGYTVAVNSGPPRTGTMTIAGITFTVTQDSGCAFTLNRDHQSFPGNGGNGIVNVNSSDPGCAWAAGTTSTFVTITSGSSGTGNGTVQYTVAANGGSTIRNETITIAGHAFTVYQGINFLDVPSTDPFYNEIGKLAARGVTLGCTPDHSQYCPNDPVTREQMAAFILRAKGELNPPAPASQRFNDVPPANVFYNFIDRLAESQITLGCTPDHLMYCPADPVKREQMAAFILRGLGEFNPPIPSSQRFDDVPPANVFYNFIDRLAVLNITLGCTPDHVMYCPGDSVTRAQMAAFLVRAFNL